MTVDLGERRRTVQNGDYGQDLLSGVPHTEPKVRHHRTVFASRFLALERTLAKGCRWTGWSHRAPMQFICRQLKGRYRLRRWSAENQGCVAWKLKADPAVVLPGRAQ